MGRREQFGGVEVYLQGGVRREVAQNTPPSRLTLLPELSVCDHLLPTTLHHAAKQQRRTTNLGRATDKRTRHIASTLPLLRFLSLLELYAYILRPRVEVLLLLIPASHPNPLFRSRSTLNISRKLPIHSPVQFPQRTCCSIVYQYEAT